MSKINQLFSIKWYCVKVRQSKNDFFQAEVSSKKTNKRIRLYYYDTSDRLIFVCFLEEIEDTNAKKIFRN